VNLVFDRVLEYALGHATELERKAVELKLAAGDPEYVMTHARVLGLLTELPRVIPPVAPPPFIKSRVMAQIALSAPQAESTIAESVRMRQPLSERLLDSKAPKGLSRIIFSGGLIKRTTAFAVILLGGIFASAYAVEQIMESMAGPKAPATAQIEQFRHTYAAQQQSAATADQMASNVTIDAPKAILVDNAENAAAEPGIRPIQKSPQGDLSENMQTNFGITQAMMYLRSSGEAKEYSMAPVGNGLSGQGRVMWDEAHGDALLSVSSLKATGPNSHYVLWYMHDGGTPERMMSFNAASETPMSFFVNHAPSRRVSGVMITLERSSQGRIESQEVLRATARQKLHM
jgi:hypothetical protein